MPEKLDREKEAVSLLLCMLCGNKATGREEISREWSHDRGWYWGCWVYCPTCDCWTEHPIEDETCQTKS